MKTIILLTFLMSFGLIAHAQTNLSSRIGIVESSDAGTCLSIANSKLKKGDKVQIVFAGSPQKVVVAKIGDKLEKPCTKWELNQHAENSSYLIDGDFTDYPVIEFGIVSDAKFSKKSGRVFGDIDGNGKPEYFRRCNADEGVYLTVWTSKDLSGKRLWKGYHYSGYEIIPNCKKAEWK